jgi:hypothetical protein
MKTLTTMRVVGSIMVIAAYFVVLHVNMTAGVIMNSIADTISIPYFVKTKSWDIVIMLGFLLAISFSKLLS